MSITCACGCGRELPPRSGPGRPAKYLAEHRPDKRVGRRRPAPLPPLPPITLPVAPPSIAPVISLVTPPSPTPPSSRPTTGIPSLVSATLEELTRAGRAETPEGLIVLTIAAQIAAGGGTQAGLASLVREFHTSKARALEGAAEKDDVVAAIFGTGS